MDLSHLHELFPDADFGFSMKMGQGPAAGFFQSTPSGREIRAERDRLLLSAPGDCVGIRPGGERLVESLWALAGKWDGVNVSADHRELGTFEKVMELGRRWEPDFLVLAPDQDGRFILEAGCVCFPSGWSLRGKMGKPLETIHGVVPGLNPAIGHRIQTFLARMKPGAGWRRSNWGISSSPERNQHPDRRINRLDSKTAPESTWVRIEHQVLTRLPDGVGILFGIRLENVGLPDFRRDVVLRTGLHRALATMPDTMARYKNMGRARSALLRFLSVPSDA